jgi:hypothetical protein
MSPIMKGRIVTELAKTGTQVAVRQEMSPELVKVFAGMAMLVPSETTDALDSIIGAILQAPSWEQLADPWESVNAEKLAGKVFRIDDLTRRPSDFKEGLGIFLVVHCVDTKTGESLVFTTSATAVVAQLVRAYSAGWLPLFGELIVADRATEAGYRPHHLKFHGQANPPKQAAEEQAPY